VEPGSSVSIVSGYGKDDRAIEVRSPADAKDFCSNLLCPDQLWTQPISCPMVTGGPFHGGKARPGRDADHLSPSSSEVVNEYELSIPPLSPCASTGFLLDCFALKPFYTCRGREWVGVTFPLRPSAFVELSGTALAFSFSMLLALHSEERGQKKAKQWDIRG
jgi:hypothetical protein